MTVIGEDDIIQATSDGGHPDEEEDSMKVIVALAAVFALLSSQQASHEPQRHVPQFDFCQLFPILCPHLSSTTQQGSFE